jgi:hypothetical protein
MFFRHFSSPIKIAFFWADSHIISYLFGHLVSQGQYFYITLNCQTICFREYFLSLNKKDALNGQLKVKGDCDIVSGDLIYIVQVGDQITGSASSHIASILLFIS